MKFASVTGPASTLGLGLDAYMLVAIQDTNTNEGMNVLVPESVMPALYKIKQGATLRIHGELRKVSDGAFPMFFVSAYEPAGAP